MKRAATGKDSFLYFICEQAKALQRYSHNTVNPEGTPIVFYPQKTTCLCLVFPVSQVVEDGLGNNRG